MYKPINGWTKAKIIEKIREHVPTDERCMFYTTCAYRNDEGKRCAVGAFLPDNFEDFDFIGGVEILLETYDDLVDKLPLGLDGLVDLQNVHDQWHLDSEHDSPQTACVAWVEENVHD